MFKSGQVRGDLLVLLAALIWGVAFYFQKIAMNHIGPLLFLGLRSLVAVLVLIPFAVLEQKRLVSVEDSILPFATLGGVMFFLAGAVQQFGIVTATVTNTSFLTALYVVFTPFVFWVIKRTRPDPGVWIAVCLSMVGTYALSGSNTVLTQGDWLVAGAAALWATHIVITSEAGRLAQPLTYTCIQFFVVTVLALTAAVLFEPIHLNAVIASWSSILYVGILSSAFTFGMMAVALRFVPAPRAAVLLSAEVVFAAIAGYVLLGERLSLINWMGACLIVAGILLVRFKDLLGRTGKERVSYSGYL